MAPPSLPTRRALLPLLWAAVTAISCDSTRYREAEVRLDAEPVAGTASSAARRARALRFSVAAVQSPRDTYAAYSRLFGRMGSRLGLEIEFVQRRTYREVNDLLAAGELDAAFVCTGGYLDLRRRAPGGVEVLAVPTIDGSPTYRSLVVAAAGSPIQGLEDLAGRRFAFTDELSFSGRAYVVRWLRDRGRDPERFFASTIFTRSHDRSLAAVAAGIADGAAVHSAVYDLVVEHDPTLAGRLRVVHRSPPFGSMPVVASTRLPAEERERLRRVLLGLADDPEGAEALRVLGIDGFVVPPPGLYATAERVVEGAR
jgi:phosphonate transport system substrate-binding protein